MDDEAPGQGLGVDATDLPKGSGAFSFGLPGADREPEMYDA